MSMPTEQLATITLILNSEEVTALKELVGERVKRNHAIAEEAAKEERLRELDRERAIAKVQEEMRFERMRQEAWGKR